VIEAGSTWRRKRDGVLVEILRVSESRDSRGCPDTVVWRRHGGREHVDAGWRFAARYEPATVREVPQHRVDHAREEHGAIASDRAGSGDLGLDGAGGGDGDSAGHVPTVSTRGVQEEGQ